MRTPRVAPREYWGYWAERRRVARARLHAALADIQAEARRRRVSAPDPVALHTMPDDVLSMIVAHLSAGATASLSRTCRSLLRVRGLYRTNVLAPGERLFDVFSRKTGPVPFGDRHDFALASKLPLILAHRGTVNFARAERQFLRNLDVAPLASVNAAGRPMPLELGLMGHLNVLRYSLAKQAWPRARLSCILSLGDLVDIVARHSPPIVLTFDSLAAALDSPPRPGNPAWVGLAGLRGKVTIRTQILVPVDRLQFPGTDRWLATLRESLATWLPLVDHADRVVFSSNNLPSNTPFGPSDVARSPGRTLVLDPWIVRWDRPGDAPLASSVEHVVVAVGTTARRTHDCQTDWPEGFSRRTLARWFPRARTISFDIDHRAGSPATVSRFFAPGPDLPRLQAAHVRFPAAAKAILASGQAAFVYLTTNAVCSVVPGNVHGACGDACVLRKIDGLLKDTDDLAAVAGTRVLVSISRDFVIPAGWRDVAAPRDDMRVVEAHVAAKGFRPLAEPWLNPTLDEGRLERGDLLLLVMTTTSTTTLKFVKARL